MRRREMERVARVPMAVQVLHALWQLAPTGVYSQTLAPLAEATGASKESVSLALMRLRTDDAIGVTRIGSNTREYRMHVRPGDYSVRTEVGRPGEWDDIMPKLRLLWAEGHSIAEIGRRLGKSKNAVVGRAHRAGLPSRPSPLGKGGGEPRKPSGARAMNVGVPKVTLPPLPSEHQVIPFNPPAPPPARFNPALLPRAGSLGPMRVDFRSPLPRVPVIEKPARQWIADDGSAATGPSQRPCQFVVRDGSLTKTWIFCGVPAARGAWCADHRAVCYINVRRAVAA